MDGEVSWFDPGRGKASVKTNTLRIWESRIMLGSELVAHLEKISGFSAHNLRVRFGVLNREGKKHLFVGIAEQGGYKLSSHPKGYTYKTGSNLVSRWLNHEGFSYGTYRASLRKGGLMIAKPEGEEVKSDAQDNP